MVCTSHLWQGWFLIGFTRLLGISGVFALDLSVYPQKKAEHVLLVLVVLAESGQTSQSLFSESLKNHCQVLSRNRVFYPFNCHFYICSWDTHMIIAHAIGYWHILESNIAQLLCVSLCLTGSVSEVPFRTENHAIPESSLIILNLYIYIYIRIYIYISHRIHVWYIC